MAETPDLHDNNEYTTKSTTTHLDLDPSPSSELFIVVVYSVPHRRTLDTQRSVREVTELYGSEKSFVVEAHRLLSGLHSIALIALDR
ncbi:hypothetical protein Scep_011232 [Stephania cephalantha]|uniref:Uncharacterized protein n=1 Tax=Stephania cephalantha TaxID=152367 RepID=A0AAP0JCY7_9MAGN